MKQIHYAILLVVIVLCVGYFVIRNAALHRSDQLEQVAPELGTAASENYQDLEQLRGDELKQALHQRIRNHRVLTYAELWNALRDLDAGEDGKVVLIYQRSQRSSSENGGNQGDWNREHLWPRAYGIGRSSIANTDLHHIRASDVDVNAKRGHLYFDETDGEDYGGKRYSSDADSWEPPNEVKGDIARALFYMAVRYEGDEANATDLEISNTPDIKNRQLGKLSILLEWHHSDPVSDEERARNNKIYRSYQGNRNPFIDHPEFADRVFKN
ncbi:extracellular ribonuclease [Oceaniferula spumae]|uniref:Extracellular ribonuclease n=1 Tax=Oceaniferula spumae TaxID=2979115 RepID=A0AAT9FPT6_9BACT